MRTGRTMAAAVIAAAVILGAAPAQATVTVYTDQQAFAARTGVPQASIPAGAVLGSGVPLGRLTVAAPCGDDWSGSCVLLDSGRLFAGSGDVLRRCINAIPTAAAPQFDACVVDQQTGNEPHDPPPGTEYYATNAGTPVINDFTVITDGSFIGLLLAGTGQGTVDYIVDGVRGTVALGNGTGFIGFVGDGPFAVDFSSTRITELRGYYAAAQAAVPEPASWALMLAGFAAISCVLRRRRVRFAVA